MMYTWWEAWNYRMQSTSKCVHSTFYIIVSVISMSSLYTSEKEKIGFTIKTYAKTTMSRCGGACCVIDTILQKPCSRTSRTTYVWTQHYVVHWNALSMSIHDKDNKFILPKCMPKTNKKILNKINIQNHILMMREVNRSHS